MRILLITLLIAAGIGLGPIVFGYNPAHAQSVVAGQWTVVQSVGEVSVSAEGIKPAAIKPAEPLPAGATVITGETGRAILVRGNETIMVTPRSRVHLPAATGSRTVIQQTTGTLIFKISKRPVAHFEVETPYLAAIVKGTTFSVSVDGASAAVHVHEGAVEVVTRQREMAVLTRAGQISRVLVRSLGEILTTGIAPTDEGADAQWRERTPDVEMSERAGPAWAEGRGFRLKRTTTKPPETGTLLAQFHTQKSDSIFGAAIELSPMAEIAKAALLKANAEKKKRASEAGLFWRIVASDGTLELDGEAATPEQTSGANPLAAGTTVETSTHGSAVLGYGETRIALSANAKITLPSSEGGSEVSLEHLQGQVRYSVRRMREQAFLAVTQHFTAKVKGTVFTITSDDQQTQIDVSTGKVEVLPHQGAEKVTLAQGERAWILSEAPDVLLSNGGARQAKADEDAAVAERFFSSFSGTDVRRTPSRPALRRSTSAPAPMSAGPKIAAPVVGLAPRPITLNAKDPHEKATASKPKPNAAKQVRDTHDGGIALNSRVQFAAPKPLQEPGKDKKAAARTTAVQFVTWGLYALGGVLALATAFAFWRRRSAKGPKAPTADQLRFKAIAGKA